MFLAMRLRQRVSQTWLHPVPGTYPVAVGVRLTDGVQITTEYVLSTAPREPRRT